MITEYALSSAHFLISRVVACFKIFACGFAGFQQVATPEGSSHVFLKELASHVARAESSLLPGHRSPRLKIIPTPPCSPVPPIVVQQLDADNSSAAFEEEEYDANELYHP